MTVVLVHGNPETTAVWATLVDALGLELYRSARQPVMADLGRGLPAAARRPGLVLLADGDEGVG